MTRRLIVVAGVFLGLLLLVPGVASATGDTHPAPCGTDTATSTTTTTAEDELPEVKADQDGDEVAEVVDDKCVPPYHIKIEKTDCTATAQASVTLRVFVGAKWHKAFEVPYVSDGTSSVLKVAANAPVGKVELTFEEDAGEDGVVEVTAGKHKVSVKTDCATPTTSTTTTTETSTTTTAPDTTTTAPTSTTDVVTPTGTQVSFENCQEAPANLLEDQPGYRAGLDSDSDGVACELGVQQASSDSGLAYTGTSGVGSMLLLGGGLLIFGSFALAMLRLRRRKQQD